MKFRLMCSNCGAVITIDQIVEGTHLWNFDCPVCTFTIDPNICGTEITE